MTGSSDKVKGKMLKLLKNDFLASSRVIPLFYLVEIVALGVYVVGRIIKKDNYIHIGSAITVLVSILLIFVTFFFVVYDYQKSLFGPQGYLSFTLPVNSRQLLGSKFIIYGLWMVVSFINLSVMSYYFTTYLTETNGEIVDGASFFLQIFGLPSIKQLIIQVIYYVLCFFGMILSFTIMVYFSIALSHIRQFQKAYVIWAILIFAGTLIILILGIHFSEKLFGVYVVLGADKSIKINFGEVTSNGTPFDFIPFVFLIIQDIVYFFLTAHIMHKRINIS